MTTVDPATTALLGERLSDGADAMEHQAQRSIDLGLSKGRCTRDEMIARNAADRAEVEGEWAAKVDAERDAWRRSFGRGDDACRTTWRELPDDDPLRPGHRCVNNHGSHIQPHRCACGAECEVIGL